MAFSSQEYWSGLPFPSPGDLSSPGIKPKSPTLQAEVCSCITKSMFVFCLLLNKENKRSYSSKKKQKSILHILLGKPPGKCKERFPLKKSIFILIKLNNKWSKSIIPILSFSRTNLSDARKDWRQKEKRVSEIGMVRDSMNMNLSKLREIVKDREAWAVHAVQSPTWLSNWTTAISSLFNDSNKPKTNHLIN